MSTVPPRSLAETFSGAEFSTHGSKWNELWQESNTPWDRGGPSLALNDVLQERKDLVPPPSGTSRRQTALVPGCGRGHDVLLLAAFGYDAYGLDYSASAKNRAIENEKAVGDEAVYQPREGVPDKGRVTWLTGDFFENDWLDEAGVGGTFDLIYDYTVRLYPLCVFGQTTSQAC